MNYYEILEVPVGAGFTEIKSSYRRLVKLYHPDLNSSAIAKERIVQITGAYELLSDPAKKMQYDALLRGEISESTSTETQSPEQSAYHERNARKQEYIKRKRVQEQRNWEQLFKVKVKFYKAQRYFASIFIVVSLIYTWDHYSLEEKASYTLQETGLNNRGECYVNLTRYISYKTHQGFYYDVNQLVSPKITVMYSTLHQVPVALRVENGNTYNINNTIRSFNNFFGFLLGFLGMVLIANHQYSDWRLTLGLLPFFVMLFYYCLLTRREWEFIDVKFVPT